MFFEYVKQHWYLRHNWPTLQRVLSAIAELLVNQPVTCSTCFTAWCIWLHTFGWCWLVHLYYTWCWLVHLSCKWWWLVHLCCIWCWLVISAVGDADWSAVPSPVLGESWDSQWECSSVSAMSVSAVSCLGSQRKRRIYWLTSVSDLLSWGQWLYFLCIYCIIMIWCKLNFIIFTLILSCSSNVCWTLFCCVPWHLVTALYTVIQKKRVPP